MIFIHGDDDYEYDKINKTVLYKNSYDSKDSAYLNYYNNKKKSILLFRDIIRIKIIVIIRKILY
jgi:hypothetical protein